MWVFSQLWGRSLTSDSVWWKKPMNWTRASCWNCCLKNPLFLDHSIHDLDFSSHFLSWKFHHAGLFPPNSLTLYFCPVFCATIHLCATWMVVRCTHFDLRCILCPLHTGTSNCTRGIGRVLCFILMLDLKSEFLKLRFTDYQVTKLICLHVLIWTLQMPLGSVRDKR